MGNFFLKRFSRPPLARVGTGHTRAGDEPDSSPMYVGFPHSGHVHGVSSRHGNIGQGRGCMGFPLPPLFRCVSVKSGAPKVFNCPVGRPRPLHLPQLFEEGCRLRDSFTPSPRPPHKITETRVIMPAGGPPPCARFGAKLRAYWTRCCPGGIGWACVTMLSGAARLGLRDDAGGRHRRGLP